MKKILNIVLNRAKVGFAAYIMEILIGTLHEYQRANQAGEYDAHRKNEEQKFDTSDINLTPVPSTDSFLSNFFKK